ncbi:MAG: ATP-binding protein [Ignavibacteriaceae bacterium]|nr:ATP-binding protein [Ignavibacteriaceae bacterium]
MSIYTSPINDIAWENIQEFCNERIAENSALDYKEGFPSNLEKTIAAFANTLGGIILIGIKEDKENKPTFPIEGINFEKGLEERVLNIILTNITPPLFPEIKVCPNEDSTKALILIRVPQSHQTPHAINKNTKVYFRTGNLSNPEDLANVNKILWMSENRKLSENLREDLISRAESRFKKIFEGKRLNAIKNDPLIKDYDKYCQLTLIISPVYPKDILITPLELKDLFPVISVSDCCNTHGKFPCDDNYQNGLTIPDGYCINDLHGNLVYHAEFNKYGLYFYKQNLFYNVDVNPQKIIRINEIIGRLKNFIESADRFFNKTGSQGLVKFNMMLSNVSEYIAVINSNYENEMRTFEDEILFEEIFLKQDLLEKKSEIIFKYLQNVLLAYNVNDWTIETIKKKYGI